MSKEDYFLEHVFGLDANVKCSNGHESTLGIVYGGVVSSEERSMGKQLMHVWNNEDKCPECDEQLNVELKFWEYPEGMNNDADVESNCDVLNKKELYDAIGIKMNV